MSTVDHETEIVYETEIINALGSNDLDRARDLLVAKLMSANPDRFSWDSPQYRASQAIQGRIVLNYSRNYLFTYFGLQTLADRYMLRDHEGKVCEDPQEFWARVATGVAMAGSKEHPSDGELYTVDGTLIPFISVVQYAQDLYEILSKHWFCLATPVLTNIGTSRGLPISCFLSSIEDSMEGITGVNTENAFISKGGGGLGNYYGNLRYRGAKLKSGGSSSGIIPFLKIMDAQILAVNQGGSRRGAGAAYLPVWHPEIEEFIEIRKETGGDINRRCPNLNIGVVIDDKFMEAVVALQPYELRCPKTNEVVKTVDAYELFNRIIDRRLEDGEPYMLFIDNVKRATPLHHVAKGLYCETSNLCSEITLPTAADRTAVCCLGSLNLETYSQWKDDPTVVYTAVRALDNVLQAFINQANPKHYEKSIKSAMAERSIGLGVMGYHGYLMQQGLPFESLGARLTNRQIFRGIHQKAIAASTQLAEERGVCPDAQGTSFTQRNSYVLSIAPTASISTIMGNATPCIEPITGNAYLNKTLSGNFLVKNRFLEEVLAQVGQNTTETWKSIIANDGSVQHLPFLSDEQKAVFRTAWEINQRELVQQAGDRQPYICQAQSLNLFFDVVKDGEGSGVSRKYLFDAHVLAWAEGCKSLYYVRSRSILKADSVERQAIRQRIQGESCAVCQ